MNRSTDPADHLRKRGYLVTDETQPRTWVVELPAGIKLLNANDRPHWSARNKITQSIRQASFVMARNARIPPLRRVRITVEYQPPRKTRTRDGGNWAPSGKAAIDGLRDAQVLEDDDSSRLVAEEYRIGEPFPRGRLVLHITEVSQEKFAAAGDGTA